MEYSFVHYAGTLWSDGGPVEPDETLWHTVLPVHPSQPGERVPLESGAGRRISVCAVDLACVLLLQQPQQFDDGNSPDVSPGSGLDGESAKSQREPSPRALGSVAALTGGLTRVESMASTQTRSRQLLETALNEMDARGWTSVDLVESETRPWRLMAVNPPRNFRQAPKFYARRETAERNREALVQALKVAHAASALRTTRRQIGVRLSGERPFSILEVLLLSQQAGIQPATMFSA